MAVREKATTIYMGTDLYKYIQQIADEEGRTFSAMAERLLRGCMEQSKAAANG